MSSPKSKSSSKKVNGVDGNELDKLTPFQIVAKFYLDSPDNTAEYWRERTARQFNLGKGEETDLILDIYSHLFDSADSEDTIGSYYDAFHGLAGKLGYPTVVEIEGGVDPKELLLPTLQRGDLESFTKLLADHKPREDHNYLNPSDAEQILWILVKKGAWPQVVEMVNKIEDIHDEAFSVSFLLELFVLAPKEVSDEVVKVLIEQAEEVGIPDEIKDEITRAQIEADLLFLGKVDKIDKLLPDQALELAVASGKPSTVRAVFDAIDLEKLFRPVLDIIIGSIRAGNLKQADLDQLDLSELDNSNLEKDSIFRTFEKCPNKRIFDLLIANNIIPPQESIQRLMDIIPSWEPIWISLVNQLTEAPSFSLVDEHHRFDKQAHLYLAKRFPNYGSRQEFDEAFLNNPNANADEVIKSLSSKMPGINQIKEVSK